MIYIAPVTLICLTAQVSYAQHPFYAEAEVGLLQGNFSVKYNDLTSTLPQNYQDNVLQSAYTAGLALGYRQIIATRYLLGLEIAGNRASNYAYYSPGVLSDKLKLKYNIDFAFVPGLLLNQSISTYLKLGISSGYIYDHLVSPAGYTPQNTVYHYNLNRVGFLAGIGVRKDLASHWAVFAEYLYRDYGSISFKHFTNLTATYSHNARLTTNALNVGLAFNF